MSKKFLYKSCIVCAVFMLISFIGIGQGKKDVGWSENGLSPKNYRLVRSHSKDNIIVGAVTGSKPAMDASVLNIDGKRILRIMLSNRFDYETSWMLKSQIHNAALMKHEQGHFDINEIYTRKTFEQFKNYKFTNDFRQEIYTIMQSINRQLLLEQHAYETQTMNGSDVEMQAKWNEKIADELASVPSYKNQTVEQELPLDK